MMSKFVMSMYSSLRQIAGAILLPVGREGRHALRKKGITCSFVIMARLKDDNVRVQVAARQLQPSTDPLMMK